MTPVIKHLPLEDSPLIDTTSGIRNADRQHGGARLRRADNVIIPVLWGILAGALLTTGTILFICH